MGVQRLEGSRSRGHNSVERISNVHLMIARNFGLEMIGDGRLRKHKRIFQLIVCPRLLSNGTLQLMFHAFQSQFKILNALVSMFRVLKNPRSLVYRFSRTHSTDLGDRLGVLFMVIGVK